MFSKLLVPLDGSQTAEHALDLALQLRPEELLLLRVPTAEEAFVEGGIAAVFPHEPQDEHAVERATAYLTAVQERLARPGVTIRTLIQEGDIAGEIVDTAADEMVDLIVMSAHGRSALRLWMLGGVAERVLRHARRPVLLARNADALDKIVVLLDGSALAEQILPLVFPLAQALDAEIILLNVSEPEILGDASEYLQWISLKYQTEGVQLERQVISGDVASAIVEYVGVEQIPLVAMVTHGYSGAKRWAYGSVAEKVVRGADCSMLLLRPPIE